MKPSVGMLNLGCPRNLVDAESILGRLKSRGHAVYDIQKAQIAIINTCAFIEDAKRESIDAILELIELKKSGKLEKIIACGCLVQRYGQKLQKELPEVDCWVGSPSLNHSARRFGITPKHYAYLKICESCINNCSFCVIPQIKGKFLSLEMDDVLKKARAFDEEGISELNIIGQDISSYGWDLYHKRKLPGLVKEISRNLKNIGWIRLLYLYPDSIIGPLLDVIKDEPKICKYIDLPIQHINDRILRLMRRRSSRGQILDLLEKIRKKLPEAAVRTSIIVGFPSETEKEFEELLDFIKEAKFERLGAFIYSREEGTLAYGLSKQVPKAVKNRRFDAVMSCQQQVSEECNKELLGKTLKVLIEEKSKGCYLGRTQFDAPEVDGQVYVNSKAALKPGEFRDVLITGTLEYDLIGEAYEYRK